MPVTRKFISSSVGPGKTNNKSDVRALQQLLIAAGQKVEGGADGGWGDKTATALESYQKRREKAGVKLQKWVEPGDFALLLMAYDAGILFGMPGKSGMPGVLAMHEAFVQRGTKYNAGAEKGQGNRAVWGVDGNTGYAVQTTSGAYIATSIEMDCTTYVNLMLSIYVNGHCHSAPYAASCADFGGVSAIHCARDRYSMPLVRRSVTKGATTTTVNNFETAEQMLAAVGTDNAKLFAIEVATAGTGSVTHMVLLQDGTVYECTTGQSGSACISRSLADFCAAKTGKIYYLFGPNPNTR